MLHINLWKK